VSTVPFPSEPRAPDAGLHVAGLRVELRSGHDVVSDVSFSAYSGEIVGLVGESGSGKTTIANALLAHARPGARVVAGRVFVDGVDVLGLSPGALQRARGKLLSYVPQDPATALNPVKRLAAHLLEVLEVHEPELLRDARRQRVLSVLREVGLPAEEEFLKRFPHQLSGGQQQRAVLALAFVLRPRLIVLDEPTTALDVTTQAKVLDTIRRLCRGHDAAAVYVTHDLALAKSLVDRVIVLYAGRIAESAAREALFSVPAHPYTRGLLRAVPDVAAARRLQPIPGQPPVPGLRASGCAFEPRCEQRSDRCSSSTPNLTDLTDLAAGHRVACFHPVIVAAAESSPDLEAQAAAVVPETLVSVRHLEASYGARQVLFDVSFDLARGECLALVGESASGKTTLARSLAGLSGQVRGELRYEGRPLPLRGRERTAQAHRLIQYVFQNPHRALNPRKTVRQILGAALEHVHALPKDETARRIVDALDRVALSVAAIDRYSRELSGGERQRVAIARALVCEPQVLICDEVTSSLDVSVQATILRVLRGLQENGMSILFVTHNLGVVRAIADRVVVLHDGRVIETGSVGVILDTPATSHTRALVSDSPTLRGPVTVGRHPAGSLSNLQGGTP
jgi:peptide/nickel transport system ATP-binding protein